VTHAEAHLANGAPAAAFDCIDPTAGRDGFAGALENVVLARAHLALDEPKLALVQLEPMLASPTYRVQTVEALILTSIAAGQLHQTTAALDAFTEAVDLAQPDGIVRPFVIAGSHVPALLTQHRRVVARHLDFTNTLLTAITPNPESEPALPSTFENLTDRELLVLRYLPTMLKAGEIAGDLYLSVYTVKTHLRSIYRKLDVTTRKDAVDRARDLNLI
jgi:LuxR family maltose regulon positive regulatory protein